MDSLHHVPNSSKTGKPTRSERQAQRVEDEKKYKELQMQHDALTMEAANWGPAAMSKVV